MNILGIDDTLAGLRRGAAKFGTRVAERVARKFGVRKNAKVPSELAKAIESVLDDVAREHAPGDTPMRVSHMVGRILRKAGSKFHYEDVSAALSDELDRRGWSRHQMSNSFTPKEPEPYGLGMGGADTEQASQPPTQASTGKENSLSDEEIYKGIMIRYAGDGTLEFREEDGDLIRTGPVSGDKKIAREFVDKWISSGRSAHEADLKKRYGNDDGASTSGAVDSSSLGYESGQKTTTADRSEMLSRCLGCGLESPETKVDKCMGCGLEDVDTGQRMPLAALADRENDKRDDAFREMQAYKKHLDKLYAEQGREPRFLEDDARQEMIRDLEKKVSELSQKWMALSRENAGGKCKSCGESTTEISPDGTCAKCEGMENAQSLSELKASWDDLSQRYAWLTEELGISEDEADDLVDLPFSSLPSDVVEKMKRHFPGSPGNSLDNAAGDCPECREALANPASVSDAYGQGHAEVRERGHGGQRHLEVQVDGKWVPYCASYQNSVENAAHPNLKAWWDQADLSQRELLLEDAGASGSHQMATLHFDNLPVDVKRKMESMRGTMGNSRTNAGHLGPDAWEAATELERVGWLDAASQDIDLACRRWPELSLDVHVALQDAFDKPASRNDKRGGAAAAEHGAPSVESVAADLGGIAPLLNAEGKLPTFVFVDAEGEEVSVPARDEAAAWQQMSQDFGTPVADMRGMGIKLVRTVENATNDPKYKCSKCGEVTQASGPDEVVLKCPKCGGATDMQNAANKVVDFECVKCHHKFQTGVDYDNFDPTNYPKCPKCGGDDILDNTSDASGRILACPSCKSTRLVAADKPMYGSGYYECDACGDGTWSRDELAKMGSFKNAKRDEPCPKCKLPMKMRPADAPVDSDQYRCGNRRCTEFRTESGVPSEHFRKLNSNREEHEKLKEDLLKKLKEAKAAGDTLEAESIEKNLIKVSELLKNGSPGDVEEIERHVEGIEHELSEIKGLSNSGVSRGASKYGARQNASLAKGDRVRSDVDAQGMKRGELGTIVDVQEQSTTFGTFVTYDVKLDSGATVDVRNGHLVLSRA